MAEKVRTSFNLNEPILVQYGSFLKNIFTGDFGISYEYHIPVFKVIWEYLPFTFFFALSSFILQITLGIKLATFIARKKKPNPGKIADALSLGIYSIPTFIIGIGLIYLFSVVLNIFPSADLYSTGFNEKSLVGKAAEIISHMVLPLISLTLPGIVIFYKYSKEIIFSFRESNFIRYLYSEGVKEKVIYSGHIIPNILPQLISLSVAELSILLSGALITETLFNLPGMGRMTVTAILQRDYPLIVASTLVSGTMVLACNFLGDILRAAIDRRLTKEVYH